VRLVASLDLHGKQSREYFVINRVFGFGNGIVKPSLMPANSIGLGAETVVSHGTDAEPPDTLTLDHADSVL
jgi:hypothetical protein